MISLRSSLLVEHAVVPKLSVVLILCDAETFSRPKPSGRVTSGVRGAVSGIVSCVMRPLPRLFLTLRTRKEDVSCPTSGSFSEI